MVTVVETSDAGQYYQWMGWMIWVGEVGEASGCSIDAGFLGGLELQEGQCRRWMHGHYEAEQHRRWLAAYLPLSRIHRPLSDHDCGRQERRHCRLGRLAGLHLVG